MIKGLSFTAFSSIWSAFMQILMLAASSRYLSSVELGWAAVGYSIVALSNLFIDSGLAGYIVYKRDLSRRVLNSLLWVSALISWILAFFIVISAGLLERFFDSPGLGENLALFSVCFIFTPFVSQFQALLSIEQKLERIAIAEVISRAISFVVAFGLMLNDYGVISLIANVAVYAALKAVIFYFFLSPGYRGINLDIDVSGLRDAWDYCKYQLSGQILNYGRVHVDVYIVGAAFGMAQLGIYSLARDLVSKVPQFLTPFYSKFLYPLMTKVKKDEKKKKEVFWFGINFVVLLSALAYGSVGMLSEVVAGLLYPNKDNVAPVIMILSLFYMLRGMGVVHALLLQSTGRVRREFFWNLFATSIFTISLYFLAQLSFESMLAGMVVTQFVMFAISYFFLHYPEFLIAPVKFYSVSVLGGVTVSGYLYICRNLLFDDYFTLIAYVALLVITVIFIIYVSSGGVRGLKNIKEIYNGQ